jgi:hypothetical protein
MAPRLRAALALGSLLLLAGGLTFVARRQAAGLRAGWPPEADLMYLPTATTLRRLSLGHTELAADLVAARANVYFGTQLAARAPQRWLDQYLHTALDLDPRFHRLYASGAAMVVYHGGKITPEDVLKANAILERGVKVFPTDWNLVFQLGFNQFFELPSVRPDDPRLPAWRQAGLEVLRRAALLEGVPPWLPSLVARLLTRQGAEALAIKHLEQAYAATSSAETREQIGAKLEELRGRRLREEVEEGRRQFEADLARGYPYAPEAFSVIAGPRRDHGVELPATAPAPAAPR